MRARAFLRSKTTRFNRCPTNMFLDIDLPNGRKDTWKVHLAIVPVYNKVRTSAFELYDTIAELSHVMDGILGHIRSKQYADTQFMRCGQYLQSLHTRGLNPDRITKLLTDGAFSRYVGIVRWSIDGLDLMDFVWDTTDTLRTQTNLKQGLSAIVCLSDAASYIVDWLAGRYETISG